MQHTHVGHCQNCGRVQASSPRSEGFIAKHGYNVAWGYFAGTCSGSNKAPLEVAHDWSDAVIIACRRSALSHDESALKLRTGQTIPERCENGVKYMGRGESLTIWVSWADANETLRRKQVERESYYHERQAQHLRTHADYLEKLIPRVFNQPLQPVKKSTTVQVALGMSFTIGTDKRYEVTRINLCGGMSGRALYTEVKRLEDGKLLRMNTAAVRRYLSAKK